jgi:response regulator RpfG family c-di-GMP phosphodiesterase
MVILDLVGEPDRYETMMRIFHLKCHLKRPILVLTDNENSRFLLNIFTFGVEDYIKIWLDETILKSKVDKILRFQHWLNLYSVKNITKYIYLYFRKIITFIVDFYLYIDYNEFIEY